MSNVAKKRGLTVTQISRLKKTASSTVHMPQVVKDRLAGLADLQRSGQGVSEYIEVGLLVSIHEELRT